MTAAIPLLSLYPLAVRMGRTLTLPYITVYHACSCAYKLNRLNGVQKFRYMGFSLVLYQVHCCVISFFGTLSTEIP